MKILLVVDISLSCSTQIQLAVNFFLEFLGSGLSVSISKHHAEIADH